MHLQLEVLNLVLSQLSNLGDLVRCAAVSKAWAAAIAKVQPQVLIIEPVGYNEEEPSIASSQLRCLQKMQRQQRLLEVNRLHAFDLRQLAVGIETACPSPILQGLLVLSGCWDLQQCDLTGPFLVEAAAALLPCDLVGLRLEPHTHLPTLNLSTFKRFSKLETLQLSFEGCHALVSPVHVMLDCKLPMLEMLHLANEPFCCVSGTIDTSLPSLTDLNVQVEASQQGMALIDNLLDHCVQLKRLTLSILESEFTQPMRSFCIPKTSNLQHVWLDGPSNFTLRLEVLKPDMSFDCSHVHVCFTPA